MLVLDPELNGFKTVLVNFGGSVSRGLIVAFVNNPLCVSF